MWWVVSVTPRPLYRLERPGIYCIEDWFNTNYYGKVVETRQLIKIFVQYMCIEGFTKPAISNYVAAFNPACLLWNYQSTGETIWCCPEEGSEKK
jgi:hypothetical protein